MISLSEATMQGVEEPQSEAVSSSWNTCTAMMFAALAKPGRYVALLPAAIPATNVPWKQSASEHGAAEPDPVSDVWPLGQSDESPV